MRKNHQDRAANAFDRIKFGDNVTILVYAGLAITEDRQGTFKTYTKRTGRAMLKSPGCWALNMGGKYGVPGVATVENLVAINGKGV